MRRTDLLLDVGCLILRGSRDDTGIGEARPEQRGQYENEEQGSHHGNGWRHLNCEIGAAVNEKKETI